MTTLIKQFNFIFILLIDCAIKSVMENGKHSPIVLSCKINISIFRFVSYVQDF